MIFFFLQVTVKHRDVCQNGFELGKIANAIFLDLPHPWEAIPHAKNSLKQGTISKITLQKLEVYA